MEARPEDWTKDDVPLSQLLQLATSTPDDSLLRKYLEFLEGSESRRIALSSAEVRWIETNLEVNPLWQDHWRQVRASASTRSAARHLRRVAVAASVLVLASLSWVDAIHDADVVVPKEMEAMVVESPPTLRGSVSVTKVLDRDYILSGAWRLAPIIRFTGREELLSELEVAYTVSEDPFEKADVAYKIGVVHEAAGERHEALEWYRLSLRHRSDERSASAHEAIRRLLVRNTR